MQWTKLLQKLAVVICLTYASKAGSTSVKLSYVIQGVDKENSINIYSYLNSVCKISEISLSTSQVNALCKLSESEIKRSLAPYGYFKPEITKYLIKTGSSRRAIYVIRPGKPMRISSVRIIVKGEGKDNPIIWYTINKSVFKKGEIFNVSRYNKFLSTLYNEANNQGFLNAHFKNEIAANPNGLHCSITINLITGRQFYFGKIIFKNFPYSVHFMRRLVSIYSGELYSSKKLLKLQQEIEQSYYIKRAIIKADLSAQRNFSVPIDVYLYPPKQQNYRLGLGYGTLSGPRILAAASMRHLGQNGGHLETKAQWSAILSNLDVTYYYPGYNPLAEEWLFGASYQHFKPKQGDSNFWTLSSGYVKKWQKWESTITANYLQERFIIYSDHHNQSVHLLYPLWTNSYTSVADATHPKQGVYFAIRLQGSEKHILSTTNFIKIQTKFKYLFSPSYFNRFILRADAGVISVHDLKKMPLSLRFFTGGINSVRGYLDSSIGPGKYLDVFSIEYQQRIKENFFGAIFYDLGSASNHFNGPINRGTGFGFIYETPVGPIKIYFAKAISKKSKPNSIEFSFGPEFS